MPEPRLRSWRLGVLARDHKEAVMTENAIAKEIGSYPKSVIAVEGFWFQ
jgi:hypothetical protein